MMKFSRGLLSALFAASLLCEQGESRMPVDHWNWSDNIEFTARDILEPESLAELQQVIRDAPKRVKVFGTAHSFNDIADTDD